MPWSKMLGVIHFVKPMVLRLEECQNSQCFRKQGQLWKNCAPVCAGAAKYRRTQTRREAAATWFKNAHFCWDRIAAFFWAAKWFKSHQFATINLREHHGGPSAPGVTSSMVLEPCLPQQGGCGAEAAEGHSGGPEKAARRCCTAAKARGKTGKGAEEGGGATGVAISLGHSFWEMSSSHPKHGHWHAAARTTKYAQSNQNISKQIFDMFPRFFLELRRSKKELELREPQLQPELQRRHQARESVHLRRRSRQPRGAWGRFQRMGCRQELDVWTSRQNKLIQFNPGWSRVCDFCIFWLTGNATSSCAKKEDKGFLRILRRWVNVSECKHQTRTQNVGVQSTNILEYEMRAYYRATIVVLFQYLSKELFPCTN